MPILHAENNGGFFQDWEFLKNAYTIGALAASASTLVVYGIYRHFKKKRAVIATQPPTLQPLLAPPTPPPHSVDNGNLDQSVGLPSTSIKTPRSAPRNTITLELPPKIDERHEEQEQQGLFGPPTTEITQPIQDNFNTIHFGSALTAYVRKNDKARIVFRGTAKNIQSVNALVKNKILDVTRPDNEEQVELDIFTKQPIVDVGMKGTHSMATIDAQGSPTFSLTLEQHNTAIVTNLDTKSVMVKSAPGSCTFLQGKTSYFFQPQQKLGALIVTQFSGATNYRTFISNMLSRRMSQLRIPAQSQQIKHVEYHDSDEDIKDDISIHGVSPTPTNPSSPRGKTSPMSWGDQSPGLGSIIE